MKKSSWISVAFDDFGDPGSHGNKTLKGQSQSKKRPRDMGEPWDSGMSGSRKKQVINDELWVEKYTPKNKEELAVHKKKVAEVQGWLEMALARQHRKGGKTLLLTGPAGSGKTATLWTLARESQLDICEWTNPITSAPTDREWSAPARPDFIPIGGFTGESQVALFKDFLLRANRYNCLPLDGDVTIHRKVILVEDIPNVFFRDAQQFHTILREYQQRGQSPLVFIISDSSGGDSNERLLFPADIQAELNIANISFNPVAPTMMTKVLQRIANTESNQGVFGSSVMSKAAIESIVSASSGDVRAGINALQFSHRGAVSRGRLGPAHRETSQKSKSRREKSAAKKQTDSEKEASAIGTRDNSLFLFRALGKILYCKRGPREESQRIPRLPPHLSEHERDPLLVDPEDVVERSHVSGDFFMTFLHQNYLDFFPHLDDVIRASEYLSDADYLTVEWASRSVMQQYAASVATRGLMHSNTARASHSSKGSGLGWKPLHKPQWFATIRKARDNSHYAKALFRGHCWTPEDLQTQLLPYLSLINTTLHDPVQINFLQDICRFGVSRYQTRVQAEKLDEKDVALLEEDEEEVAPSAKGEKDDAEETVTNSQQKMAAPATEEEEEEILIEDYDSD